jgi:hypothetical protein
MAAVVEMEGERPPKVTSEPGNEPLVMDAGLAEGGALAMVGGTSDCVACLARKTEKSGHPCNSNTPQVSNPLPDPKKTSPKNMHSSAPHGGMVQVPDLRRWCPGHPVG